jgi:hypothetical protein
MDFVAAHQALRVKDLHHTNRITQLPRHYLAKLYRKNALLQQIKNDFGSFFETAHP